MTRSACHLRFGPLPRGAHRAPAVNGYALSSPRAKEPDGRMPVMPGRMLAGGGYRAAQRRPAAYSETALISRSERREAMVAIEASLARAPLRKAISCASVYSAN